MPPRRKHARIQAQITGKGREVGPIEAHHKTVMAVSRAVVKLENKTATLARQLADTRRELRGKRRELRAILQRDTSNNPPEWGSQQWAETRGDDLPDEGD